ncbi:MAG: glycosyl transferase family protein [Parasphingorhabdus sp.]|uniref:glycosyl transferase family protein n=1 Tax=Parasphingorhabdus sp. TaxID=2709688 RepID=UPI003298C370
MTVPALLQQDILMVIQLLQQELLLFTSLAILVGSIDDLVFDSMWVTHIIKKKWSGGRPWHLPKGDNAEANSPIPENWAAGSNAQPLAIFVPAWREAAVIGTMLRRCLAQWNHPHYRIYVGCYPNDDATIAAVVDVASAADNIRIVICDRAGPTSKADCLNRLWRALCQDELAQSLRFKAIILQDAEDLVHPQALTLFDILIERAALVQIPVIPRRASQSIWIAGHYGDEFAEMHGKQMVLREAMGVSIPSAGVGCALRRDALGQLSADSHGQPFDAQSLTEDYELGIQLTEGEERGLFARVQDEHGQWIATQEFFPDTLEAAVKQKSRWMTGIALAGWDRLGWNACWRENWMRLRDRKSSLAALVLALTYLTILLTAFLCALDKAGFYAAQPISEELLALLALNGIFLAWRLAVKAYFVGGIYGWREAILSVPRTIVANVINILAAKHALIQYWISLRGGRLHWHKTQHFHPNLSAAKSLKSRDSDSGLG